MADKLNLLNPNAPSFPDDGYDSLGKDGKSIVHYIHQSREQVYMQAMTLLCETQKQHPDYQKWVNSIQLYEKSLEKTNKKGQMSS